MLSLWLPTLVSFVLSFMLGALWYSDYMFAKPWMAGLGKTQAELNMKGSDFAITALMWLIASIMFSALVLMTSAYTFLSFVCIAVVVFLGFTLSPFVMAKTFEGTDMRVVVVSSAYHFCAYLLMALVHTLL